MRLELNREELLLKIQKLTAESKDPNFTAYLNQLAGELLAEKFTVKYVSTEVDRTYAMYRATLLPEEGGQPATVEVPKTAEPAAPEKAATEQAKAPVQPAEAPKAAPAQASPYINGTVYAANSPYVSAGPGNPYVQGQAYGSPYVQGQPYGAYAQGRPNGNGVYSTHPRQGAAPGVPVKKREFHKNTAEYTIGAGVLCVVGALFLLVAFILLGVNYMDGFAKGMSMFGISALVIVLSEVFLRRKLPLFSNIITGLGVCALFVSDMVNFLYLESYNVFVALAVLAACAGVAIAIGRFRASGTLTVATLIASYGCIVPLGNRLFAAGAEYSGDDIGMQLILAAFALAVNLTATLLPVKKSNRAVDCLHMASTALFTIVYSIMACVQLQDPSYVLPLIASSFLIVNVVYASALRREKNGVYGSTADDGVLTAFYIVGAVPVLLNYVIVARTSPFELCLHLSTLALACVGSVMFAVLAKSEKNWLEIWFLMGTLFIVYGFGRGDDLTYWVGVGTSIGLFLAAKALSRVRQLKAGEIVITAIALIRAVIFFTDENPAAGLGMIAAFLISLAFVYNFRSLVEEAVVLAVWAFLMSYMDNEMLAAAMAGVMLLCSVAFNYLPFFRDKFTNIFNYINLGLMCILYAYSASVQNLLLYAILTALGLLYMLLLFRKKFGMGFRIRSILLVVFLCYMTLIYRMEYSIMKSCILMVFAIAAVIAGFIRKEKPLRITGLVLTILVCMKVAFFDFSGIDVNQKIILFLVVGGIALAISGIYVTVEKKVE